MTQELLQQLMNWLVLGSIYALLAVGFSLLFGVLNIIHFSHGDVSLIAPFLVLAGAKMFMSGIDTGSLILLFVMASVVVGLIGIGIDKVVVQPFRNAPAMMVMVSTVALGIVVRELIRHVYPAGSNPYAFTTPFGGAAFSLAGVAFNWLFVVDLCVTATLLSAIWYFLHRTPLGIEVRAVAQDRDAARMMGIHPGRIFRVTFFITSFTGGIAALLYTAHIGVVRFDFGILVGLMAFSAAVIGGLGSVTGAIVGGLLLAGVETLVQATVPGGTSYRLVAAFVLVILFLLFKPAGIFGKPVIEKV